MYLIDNIELQTKIRQAIIDNPVSVNRFASDIFTNNAVYTVETPDGTIFNFEQLELFRDKNKTIFEYCISVNGHEIASTTLADGKKTMAQPAQTILGFFQMCSSKLIYQEMQNNVHNIKTLNKFKLMN